MQNITAYLKLPNMTTPTTLFNCIATIGPASGSKDTLTQMKEAGMTIGRLNMSHGTHQSHGEYIKALRAIDMPIVMDLSGPRVSTKDGHGFDPSLPALTDKDRYDLAFAHEQKIPWVALSYAKNNEDLDLLKDAMQDLGMQAKIITKIEHQMAIDNLDGILAVTDAILIGRGDLGDALGLEHLGRATLEIIQRCKAAKKTVAVATEILESMHQTTRPTRAEATDAWLHAYAGADGVMLSGETAVGQNPVKAVEWLCKLYQAGKRDRAAGLRLIS